MDAIIEKIAKRVFYYLIDGKRVFLGPMEKSDIEALTAVLKRVYAIEVTFDPQYSINFDLDWDIITTKAFSEKNLVGYEVGLKAKASLQERIDRIKSIGFDMLWKKLEMAMFIDNVATNFIPSDCYLRGDGVWISPAGVSIDPEYSSEQRRINRLTKNTMFDHLFNH